jgi:hypothetical protein
MPVTLYVVSILCAAQVVEIRTLLLIDTTNRFTQIIVVSPAEEELGI